MSFVRKLKNFRYHLFYGALLRRDYKLITLGNRSIECHWNFYPDNLTAKSVVYSGGVGRDVSFEHELVAKKGCSIVLLDPSPTGIETMALPVNQIPEFKFIPVGLAGHCKLLKLSPPKYPEEGSWFKYNGDGNAIEARCEDLATLMQRLGHNQIDLLKIDIEGSEYEVLADLLKKRLPVSQVLVEFHHDILPGIRRRETVRAILKMVAAGYKLLDQCGSNHTFFRP
ncbi:MAG TPA: FkbM family methyltransferase [Verrucomicrobiae bacterium]